MRICSACEGYLGCTRFSTRPSITPCDTRSSCAVGLEVLTPALLILASAFVSAEVSMPIALGACTDSGSGAFGLAAGWCMSLLTIKRWVTSGSGSVASATPAEGFALGFNVGVEAWPAEDDELRF